MGKEWHWGQGKTRPAGCMSGILHFLDFHQLLFNPTTTKPAAAAATHSGSASLPVEKLLKGVEAPRNSLEVDAGTPPTICTQGGLYHDIPVGIQIPAPAALLAKKTTTLFFEEERKSTSSLHTKEFYLERERRSVSAVLNEKRKEVLLVEVERRSTSAIPTVKKPFLSQEDERRSTESPRTPGLVARLMGLDMLPDGAPPREIICNRPQTLLATTASFVHNHQCQPPLKKTNKMSDENKRNSSPPPRRPLQDLNCNIPPTPWDEGTKVRLHPQKENYALAAMEPPRKRDGSARHVLEEKISNRNPNHLKEIVKQVKEDYIDALTEKDIRCVRTRPAMMSIPCNKKQKTTISKPPPSRSPPSPKLSKPVKKTKLHQEDDKRSPPPSLRSRRTNPAPSSSQSKEKVYERYTERIQNSFGRHLSSISTANASFRSPKAKAAKQYTSSLRPIPENISTLHRPQCSRYVQTVNSSQEREGSPEFQYVRSILVHAGILARSTTPYSTARPIIDNIIFYKLELEFPAASYQLGSLRLRCNRRLLFHLVQETTSQIRPGNRHDLTGEPFLKFLWAQIQRSPSGQSCDINELVSINQQESMAPRLQLHTAVDVEAEHVVGEIAGSIVDSLVRETAASLSSARYGLW